MLLVYTHNCWQSLWDASLKSTYSYPKQYYIQYYVFQESPSLLHVGRYIFTDHEMTYVTWKFLNLRVIPVDGHAVFKPLDWLVVWIGGFTLQHQCPCLALSLVLQFLKELDISCNKFKACTAIFYQFPQPFRQPSKFLWCYTKQFYKW